MPAVERELAALIPAGVIATDHALVPVVAKADRALKPISIALGVFGGIALLAALLIAAQLIARRFRLDRGELGILRALGASPAETVLDTLIGFEVSILWDRSWPQPSPWRCRRWRRWDQCVPSTPHEESPSTGPFWASVSWCSSCS